MKIHVLFALVLAVLLLPAVSATLLDELFEPFRDFDVASFYDTYQGFVDFTIYLIIFVGVAQITLGKRFGDSRGAKAIVVGIGLTLALSLLIMQETMDFSLVQFSPFAAGVFIILMATMIFRYMHSFAGVFSSFSIAFIITYFSLKMVVPSFFWYIKEKSPFLNSMLALIAIVSFFGGFVGILRKIFPDTEEIIKGASRKLEMKAKPLPRTEEAELEYEEKALYGRLGTLARKRVKESAELIGELEEVFSLIQSHGSSHEGRQFIARKIEKDIVPREHSLAKEMRVTRKIMQRIESFDIGVLRALKNKPQKVKGKAKTLVQQQLNKINAEQNMKKLEEKVEKHIKALASCIEQSAASLKAQDVQQAKNWILSAIDNEKQALETLREVKNLQKLILEITRQELAIEE